MDVSKFEATYGSAEGRRLLEVRSPGRTELAGNHTDHEGGSVIAAAVDRHVEGVFSPNNTHVIRVVSEGYGLVEVDANDLAPRENERGTTAALVRGMAAQVADLGYAPTGFDAMVRSGVLGGSGLSSSAAFELEVGQALNALWAGGALSAEALALMAQRAEQRWFGKPCGLMDQAAVALGGVQHMSFADPAQLAATALDFDFAEHGYALCLVAVGADHAALIDDYAAVPAEMQAVARALGHDVLGETTEAEVLAALPTLRAQLGDRPVLRALHYFREDRLVAQRAEALAAGDVERFLELTRLSGASSAMYLQNVSVAGAAEQPAMVALALAEELLAAHAAGRGAVRIHGGGFGGTIQAFVPLDAADAFAAGMDAVFGDDACGVYGIDHEGACARWMR